jgi:hypothetical protein
MYLFNQIGEEMATYLNNFVHLVKLSFCFLFIVGKALNISGLFSCVIGNLWYIWDYQ